MLNKKGDLEKFNLENFCADGLMSVADEEGQFYVVSRNSKKISWFLLGDDNSERFSTIVNSNLSELKLRKVDIVDKDIIVILDEYEITETYEGDNNRPTKRYRYENIFVLKLGTNGEHFWTHEKIRHLDTSVSGERSKAVGIGAMMVNGQLLLVWNENVKKHGSITSNFEFLDMKTGSIKMQRELVKGVGVHFRHVGLLSVSNKLPSATFYIPNNDISWSIIGEDLKHSYGDACFRYIINLKF
jgi:hypothetical protein